MWFIKISEYTICFFSHFQSSFLVCKSISPAILFAQLLWFKEMQVDCCFTSRGPGEQAGGKAFQLFLGIVCTIAKCFSTPENILQQTIFLSPKCTYLFWSWQLSITKVLCRYCRKIHLDGEKSVPSGCFALSSVCQSSCWQQPNSLRFLSFTVRGWPRNPANKVYSEANLFFIRNYAVCPFLFVVVKEANHVHRSEVNSSSIPALIFR